LHGGFPFRSSEGEAVDCLASDGELFGVGHAQNLGNAERNEKTFLQLFLPNPQNPLFH
jgi:hypothetical protein